MNVDEVLKQAESLTGQVVDIEGYLLVIQEGENQTPYLSLTDTINDNTNLFIDQSLAELRKIIQPMHTLFLSHRGKMTNPPYLYNFPLKISGRIGKTAENVPLIHDIESVSLIVNHPPNLAQWIQQEQYRYSAHVEYGTSPESTQEEPIKATISSSKEIRFTESADDGQVIGSDENAYARNILQKTVTIPGWLKYGRGIENNETHFLLETFAVRSSLIGVGPLRSINSIWWRPTPQHKIIRAHTNLATEITGYEQRAEITGQIDYLNDEVVPIDDTHNPQLAFTKIDKIVLYSETYLLDSAAPPAS